VGPFDRFHLARGFAPVQPKVVAATEVGGVGGEFTFGP